MNTSIFRTPEQLVTGSGSVKLLGEKALQLGASKVLLVTDHILYKNGLITSAHHGLKEAGLEVEVVDSVEPEPPFENVEQIYEQIKGKGFDLLVGIGGGSVLDVTKLLAVMMTNDGDVRDLVGIDKVPQKGAPFILLPTTAGTGSEVTYNAIFTDTRDRVKKGIVSAYLLPDVAIVDPELSLSCPPAVTAATGMDALVHAIESYTAIKASPLTDGIALQAIKLMAGSLREAVFQGSSLKAREEMAMGSLLAGISLGNAGVGAVHALAYPLGGKFKVAHGVANSLLLPYVMKYNVAANLPKFAEIAKAMGENVQGLSLREAAHKAVASMAQLAHDIGIPRSLLEVGVTEEDLPGLAREASKIERLLQNNPRWLREEEIKQIYLDALLAK